MHQQRYIQDAPQSILNTFYMNLSAGYALLMVHRACTPPGVPIDMQRVEQLRKAAGLTQQQVADALGLSSKSHWGNIIAERQDVTSRQIDAIARLFKVKPQSLWK